MGFLADVVCLSIQLFLAMVKMQVESASSKIHLTSSQSQRVIIIIKHVNIVMSTKIINVACKHSKLALLRSSMSLFFLGKPFSFNFTIEFIMSSHNQQSVRCSNFLHFYYGFDQKRLYRPFILVYFFGDFYGYGLT